MMANCDKCSHIESQDAMKLLPDVLNLLLDPSKQLIDDTCVEKLLSWLMELASRPVTLKNLLQGHIIRFLQSSASPSCDSANLTFALQLVAILLNSLSNFTIKIPSAKSINKESEFISECSGHSIDSSDQPDDIQACIKHADVISQLTIHLLVSANKLPYWSRASVRNAWLISAKAAVCSRCPSQVMDKLGILDIALDMLNDKCMFVVSGAQQLLAAVITSTCACCKRDSQSQHNVQPKIQDTLTLNGQQSCQASGNQYLDCDGFPVQTRQDHHQGCDSRVVPVKRVKISHSDAGDCECNNHLEVCIHKLKAILKPVKLSCPLRMTNSNQTKSICVAVGVFQSLLTSHPVTGHTVLRDVSIISIMSDILESPSVVSPDVCSTIVEFIQVFLQTHDWNDTFASSSALSNVIGLPLKLLNIHQFRSAFQLAAVLYSALHLPNIKERLCNDEMLLHSSATVTQLVLLPLECFSYHNDIDRSKLLITALTTGRDDMLHDMIAHKDHCITIMCHALSALEIMALEDLDTVTRQQPTLLDDVTSVLSLTLGESSHHVACHSPLSTYLHGSLKLTKAVLRILMVTVVSSSEGSLNYSESSAQCLLLQLMTVLKNPESDSMVVSKCLEVLAIFLSLYINAMINIDDKMKILGDVITKRSYDPRWEIRDSVMSFFKHLMQFPQGLLLEWSTYHHFHMRVSECINDGDSYVRACALDAIVEVAKHHQLWKDLIKLRGQTPHAFVREIINIMTRDSQGFARRSAVCTLTKLLAAFPWLHDKLREHSSGSQDQPRGIAEMGEDCQEASLIVKIMDGTATALLDLDWEVKLGALQFWETVIEICVPFINDSDATCENNIREQDERKVSDNGLLYDGLPSALLNLKWLVKEHQLVSRLVQVLEDEDRTVALKACQMLLKLKQVLHCRATLEKTTADDSDTDLNIFMMKTYNELKGLSLEKVLEVKMEVIDGHEYHPVSLLQDILAGTQDKDANSLDCY